MKSGWANTQFSVFVFTPASGKTSHESNVAPAGSWVLKCRFILELFYDLVFRGVEFMWNKEALHHLVENKLREYQFIIVANREPYVHRYTADRQIEWTTPASGMVSALDPIMRACG